MRIQNYKNHRFFEPTSYFLLFPLSVIIFAALLVEWVQYVQGSQGLWDSVKMSTIEVVLLVLILRIRLYALVAQDRAIRAEEQLRYYVLTGQQLDTRLTIEQIVALRFASDTEMTALAKRAVDENLSSTQIKQAISEWRADWHRV